MDARRSGRTSSLADGTRNALYLDLASSLALMEIALEEVASGTVDADTVENVDIQLGLILGGSTLRASPKVNAAARETIWAYRDFVLSRRVAPTTLTAAEWQARRVHIIQQSKIAQKAVRNHLNQLESG